VALERLHVSVRSCAILFRRLQAAVASIEQVSAAPTACLWLMQRCAFFLGVFTAGCAQHLINNYNSNNSLASVSESFSQHGAGCFDIPC